MPATYAHHRFGNACIASMPAKYRKVCEHYRELFDFGVHGPDLLFYYKPLGSNEVNRYGNEMHHWTGAQFFEICKEVYQGMPAGPERNALLAYVLGFLAHFTLDSSCHGYINQMTEESPLSHNMIESQYEAFLLRRDGEEPVKVDRSAPLHPSGRNARVVSKLFPFSEVEILGAMKGQKRTVHVFYSPYGIKKDVIRKLLKLLKMKGNFGDLFLDEEELPICGAMNVKVFEDQKKAAERYPELFENLMDYLNDKAPLDRYFNHDFEGECHEA